MEKKSDGFTGKFDDELRLKDMLGKMLEGLQIIGFDWKYIYVNESLTRQGGYSWEELKGNTMMEMYPGLEKTEVFQALKKCMEERCSKHLETEFAFPDGTKTWFELSIQPIPEGIFILSVDITARKHAEEKLKASELEYRSLIEQATDAIFISDEQGKYTDVNLKACMMLGYSKEELLTMNVSQLLVAEEAQNNPPRFNELRTGKTILSTRNLISKNGLIIPVEINAKMLSNGKMLGMVRDISDRKNTEEKLKSSEDKFRNLTETAFDAIVLVDETGNIKFWNRGAELIFGYSKEEALQKSLTMIMPEKYRNAHEQGMQRYLETGEKRVIGKVVSLEGRRKNGEQFPIEISITSWGSSSGKMFSGIIRDGSERKEAQDKILKLNNDLEHKVKDRTAELENKVRQLRESEEKFQKAFQSSAAGITITRLSDSTYLDVNDAFVKLTGYDKNELIGHSSSELRMIIDVKQREEVLQQMRESGFVHNFEMTVRNKSGRIVDILSSIDTILLNDEKYAINVIYDITDRKKSQEQLESVNKELEAFSYSVSHDLRAPLRVILGYSQILKEEFTDKLNDRGNGFVAKIQRNANRMNVLIDELLKFSKLGKKDLVKSEVSNTELVQNVLRTLANSAEKAKIIMKPMPTALADKELLEQVWMNLISNALKYSGKKNQPLIEIGAQKNSNETVYYVRDNGVGFNMEYSEKLFGVFQRLHSPGDFEGTGVGLSIVKRIITKHGGRVWAEAKVDEGATFYFSLPF